MQQPTTPEPERVRGIFRLVDSAYYKVDVCPIPGCQAIVRKLAGEPRHQHGYVTRSGMKLVDSLPPYVIERYARVLNLWRMKRCMYTLFELCLRKVKHTSHLLLPPRNKVIHRVFRRMLLALDEAVFYEASHHPGHIFEQYSRLDSTLLQGWMQRGEYLRRERCPLRRLATRLRHWRDTYSNQHRGHAPDYPNNGINYFARPHQCGYTRCMCDDYVDIKPTSISKSQARSPMLLISTIGDKCIYLDHTSASDKTLPTKKVSKAKLQADRAERKNQNKRR